MQEKLGLYEEILQQDPGARIFYPLARMYHETGRSADALSVIRQGLTNHPEHLGAMLLQIEILDGMGDEQELSTARRLIKTLTMTPAFWMCWSRLAKEEGQDDLALALQFIARSAKGEPLTWTGILASGLESLGYSDVNVEPWSAPNTGGSAPPDQDTGEEPGSSFRSGVEAASLSTDLSEALQTAAEAFRSTPLQADDTPLTDALTREQDMGEEMVDAPDDEPASFDFEFLDSDEKSESEVENPWDSPELLAENDRPESMVDDASGQGEASVMVELPEEVTHARSIPEEHVERPEEHAELVEPVDVREPEDDGSPRTRTMADLLADQGEHERALIIYTELWRATPPGEERRSLEALRKAMMDELDRREKGKVTVRKKKEKDELLSVLDGLAKRLEARTAQ
jgi:hypothetical protein